MHTNSNSLSSSSSLNSFKEFMDFNIIHNHNHWGWFVDIEKNLHHEQHITSSHFTYIMPTIKENVSIKSLHSLNESMIFEMDEFKTSNNNHNNIQITHTFCIITLVFCYFITYSALNFWVN